VIEEQRLSDVACPAFLPVGRLDQTGDSERKEKEYKTVETRHKIAIKKDGDQGAAKLGQTA